MAKIPPKSREIREFAESVIQELKQEPNFELFNTDGLATSLVRQWLTYENTAALHIGSALLFLTLSRSPLGALTLKHEPSSSNWLRELVEDWKVPEDELHGLIDQLNLTQSAEITNSEGLDIRWYVNPKEKTIGVDHDQRPNGQKPTETAKLVRIAERLESAFGGTIPEEEIPVLARSILDLWKRYNGKASIFTEDTQFSLWHEEGKDGGYSITVRQVSFPTRQNLENGGVPPERVVEAIAQINLGRVFSFVDNKGELIEFWHEPDKCRFIKRVSERRVKAPPIVCPGCGAVLGLWNQRMSSQKCGVCGRVVQG